MEIYNEQIADLLSGEASQKSLVVREDQYGNICVAELKEEFVTDANDVRLYITSSYLFH